MTSKEYDIKCSLILLCDHNNRVLLQQRTDDAKRLPCAWAYFGGGIKDGESPLEAVRREAYEELGVNLKNPELFFEQEFELDGESGYMYAFKQELNVPKSSLSIKEGQGWGWFDTDMISSLGMLEHDYRIILMLGQK